MSSLITVSNFSDLPDVAANNGMMAVCSSNYTDSSGVIYHRGYYLSDGTTWNCTVTQGDKLRCLIWELQLELDALAAEVSGFDIPVSADDLSNDSSISGSTVKDALNSIGTNLGSIATSLSGKINSSEKGAANGVMPLDSGGKAPAQYLPSTVMEYKGAWNPSTNSPALADGTGDAGDVYRASTSGTRNLGSGSQTWAAGDLIIYSGTVWEHSPAADGVSSVFGRVGAVTAQNGDYDTTKVTENTNLYFTSARARAAVRYYANYTAKDGAFPISKSGTVSSGNLVVYLTNDGTTNGTALFPNGPDLDTLMIRAVETDAPHMPGTPTYNSTTKALTVPIKKSPPALIALLGISLLGAPVAADGSVIKATIWGN